MNATVIETTNSGSLLCPKKKRRVNMTYCGSMCKYCRSLLHNAVKCVWEQSKDVHNNICIPGKPAPKHYNQPLEDIEDIEQ